MDRLLYTAMTGASGTMSRQASIAHNLANVSTPGYRAEEHRLRAVQVQSPTALPTRAFAVDASTHTDYSNGAMMLTGRPLDVAVQGKGWIAVTAPAHSPPRPSNSVSASPGCRRSTCTWRAAASGNAISAAPASGRSRCSRGGTGAVRSAEAEVCRSVAVPYRPRRRHARRQRRRCAAPIGTSPEGMT